MSKPKVKTNFYDELVDAELRQWPGVTVRRERLSKHQQLVISVDGQTARMTYPCTPSEIRGGYNTVAMLRRILVNLGAQRIERPKSEREARRPRPQVIGPLRLRRTEPLRKDPSRDPWKALAGLFGGAS